jgi:hypothetical protein
MTLDYVGKSIPKGADEKMTALKKEIHALTDIIPDEKLKIIKPILDLLAENSDFVLESNLTEKERVIISKGREILEKEFMTLKEALKAVDI